MLRVLVAKRTKLGKQNGVLRHIKKAATAKEKISCRPGGFVFAKLTVSIK